MKVYVVEFFPIEISDGNGVFSSYEKARAYFEKERERCSDIWEDFEIEEERTLEDGSKFVKATFLICGYDEGTAAIYETEIDIME